MSDMASILIVDDDELIRNSLGSYLKRHGYRILVAENGRTGLEIFLDQRPDLILLDLRMPEISGLDVLAIVREKSPQTPVIVVSGTDRISDVAEALRLGAWDYLNKPIPDMSVLLHTVQTSLQRMILLRENLAYQEQLEVAVSNRTYDLLRAKTELQKAHDLLEERVKLRTAELEAANENLRREIEERKRLERLLMHREKLKTLGAISAEVAHEIRNPLVAIGGFAQRLKNKYPDLKECEIILSQANRLEKILSRIRRYLEPVELHPAPCSVNTIVMDCIHLLSPETDRRHIIFHLDLSPDLPDAFVDPDILAQIIINLVRNSYQAVDQGENIFIKSCRIDQDIQVMVKNRGTKLAIKNPETLFMPFAEGGQSLGLPLCYRLLKEMGGAMSFTHEDDLVVFNIQLPPADQS